MTQDFILLHIFDISSLERTAHYASYFAHILQKGDVVLLEGDLGSGKTTFARTLIQTLMNTPTLTPSPTFSLIHSYDTSLGPLWHADLYRISPEEVFFLGIEEHIETGLTIIEWPERLHLPLPFALKLIFTFNVKTNTRQLALKGSSLWAQRLQHLSL